MPTIDPTELYQALVNKPGSRSERRNCLTGLREICRRHLESGSRDFSLPVIGCQCEAAGLIKARALYVGVWELKLRDVDSLKRAINPKFLKSRGWTVNTKGEVSNASGEIVYGAGYIQAIKKLLANITSPK